MVNGHKVRLAKSTMTIPLVAPQRRLSASTGVPTSLMRGDQAEANQEPAPPAGFRNPQPCSEYWGQKTDTEDSASLYAPYTAPLPYDICGYKPASSEALTPGRVGEQGQ